MTPAMATILNISSIGVHEGNSGIFSEGKMNSDGSKVVEMGLVSGE